MHGSMTKALVRLSEAERDSEYDIRILHYGRLGGQGGGEISEHGLPVASLQPQGPVDALDQDQDDWLPAHQPSHPVQ